MKFIPKYKTVKIGTLDIEVPLGTRYVTVDFNGIVECWIERPTIDLGLFDGAGVIVGRIELEDDEYLDSQYKIIEV